MKHFQLKFLTLVENLFLGVRVCARYPSYYPSYGPATGSTSFYTTELSPFSVARSSADFPKSARTDSSIIKDIKQERDVKEHTVELISTAGRSSGDIPEPHTELLQSNADAATTASVVQPQTEPSQLPRRCMVSKIEAL
ncbi:unnamed protein product [Gongylonema pulchrum]|uniref:Uncharacterized protein n=1 Tax=Gongylonema pulchrum TaxID=637853 RepID=A0A183E7Z0_9BILA|nr:unnamed protein product [Gongylonema pulchrum]